MAQYSWKDLKIEFDNAGGTLVDMSAYIDKINGLTIKAIIEAYFTAGLTWKAFVDSLLREADKVTLEGLYDDTVTVGPNVIFNVLGAIRTLKLTYGSTKTSSVETLIEQYERLPGSGGLTRYVTTLQPTGAVTEA